MHDVEPLGADHVAKSGDPARGEREPRARRERRAYSMDRYVVDYVGPARRRDHSRVDPATTKREREVAQMQLDSTLARQEPVAG